MIAGKNVLEQPELFEEEVRMYVYEEQIEGENLTDIINQRHENVKYLPGHELPPNIVACPDVVETVQDATLLIFVLPHQFIERILDTISGHIHPNARAITLIKGFVIKEERLTLISSIIHDALDIEVCALMGANVANEVAEGHFCETTIGYVNSKTGEAFKALFDSENFVVSLVKDVNGVELSGALKNIVALGAGFCDGLDYGGNTKAAIMRIGLLEMRRFSKMFFKGVRNETFFESCGLADLITTCYGGRNRRCAEAFVRAQPKKTWEEIEQELLNGQKLQGTLTVREVMHILLVEDVVADFPLFNSIFKIVEGEEPPEHITHFKRTET